MLYVFHFAEAARVAFLKLPKGEVARVNGHLLGTEGTNDERLKLQNLLAFDGTSELLFRLPRNRIS